MPRIIKKPGVLSGLKSDVGKHRIQPLWTGPCGEGPNGGITQSMMNTLILCKERSRVKYINGLQPSNDFSPRMEYGQLWHTCEEAFAANKDWLPPLKLYSQKLCQIHPLSQGEIEKWYNVCKHQYPIYTDYWSKQPEVKERTPLLQEYSFDVPYPLPSGRVVRLRGKFDSVDLIGKGKAAGIYLQENKTKGDIVESKMVRQLKFDLQTMLYLVALQCKQSDGSLSKIVTADGMSKSYPLLGVRYNVIRRPLSGGKGNIKQLEGSKNRPPETKQAYYSRLQQYFINEPEYWFMRWKVEVTAKDIEKFKTQFLTPFLENTCDWYSGVAKPSNDLHTPRSGYNYLDALHWTTPFGLYNILAEGGTTDYDSYLETGNEVGLTRVDKLFKEL